MYCDIFCLIGVVIHCIEVTLQNYDSCIQHKENVI